MDVVRRILVLLTVVSAVVGPQCCCCTFRATAADAAATPSGCCCCESDATPDSCPAGQDGHEGDHPCRCRESTQMAAAAMEPTWSGPDGSAPACLGWLTARPTASLPGCEPSGEPTDGVGWPPAGEIPTLAGRALLRALRTLRC